MGLTLQLMVRTCVPSDPIKHILLNALLQLALHLVKVCYATIVHPLGKGRLSHIITPRSAGHTYHEFAIRPRMAVIETEGPSSCGTNMSTGSQAVRSSADIWPKDCAHKTSGDLIFSAKRTRFTLFHACVRSETNALPQGEGAMTYRRNRSEDARLGTQFFVVYGIIPAYRSGRMV